MTRLIIICLLCISLFGCSDKSVIPRPDDKVVATAKVEALRRDLHMADFKVRLEDRTLFYNETQNDIRPPSVESLRDGDKIMIVQRGLQYYWTTGGNLIPFN